MQFKVWLNVPRKGSILQYFRPSLSYHLSLRSLFCLFLSGRFTQVLLYCFLIKLMFSFTNTMLDLFSSAVTLKTRAMSPKPNQVFIIPKCYIQVVMFRMHSLVHEIFCAQESVRPTPTRTGSVPKPLRWEPLIHTHLQK